MGVGKTTLAAEVIRRIFDHDPARMPAVLSGEISVDGVLSAVSGALQRHLLAGPQGPLLQAAEMAGRVDLPWQERVRVAVGPHPRSGAAVGGA